VREAVDVGHGGDEHLNADEEVLVGDYKIILIGLQQLSLKSQGCFAYSSLSKRKYGLIINISHEL